MINHHPDDNMLTEYASGSLHPALAISVRAHLQLCPRCSKQVANLNNLGAAILTQSLAEPMQPMAFSHVMDRIKQQEKVSVESAAPDVKLRSAHDPLFAQLPKVIEKLLPSNGKMKWKRVSHALKMLRLTTGQKEYEVAFQRIRSGGKIVEHGHRGIEVTLVLNGSFSDENGIYSEGDFIVRNEGDVHRPTAAQNQDCLCLTVVEAPVSVTGWLGKVVNPFLRVRPA